MGPISDWQASIGDAAASLPPRPYVPQNVPPSAPAPEAPQPPGDLDQFSQATARDVAAQPTPAAAAGRYTRAAVQAPLVAAASALPDLRDAANAAGRTVKSAGGAISEFARGLVGASDQPVAAAPGPVNVGDQDVQDLQSQILRSAQTNPPPPASASAPVAAPAVAEGTSQPQAQQQDAADEARPSNVRTYLRRSITPTAAPTVDPETFARNYMQMRAGSPTDPSIGGKMTARHLADAYKSVYLDALGKAQGAYTGETGRISALSSAQNAGTQAQEGAARVEETGQNIVQKRYSLEQQKNLQELTKKLQDPSLSDKDRRDLEQQLWILHGKPPRPDNRYKAIPGRFNPMTGTFEPGVVVDSTTGAVKTLGAAPSAAAAAPAGMKQVGTSGGVPVYEDAQGNRFLSH